MFCPVLVTLLWHKNINMENIVLKLILFMSVCLPLFSFDQQQIKVLEYKKYLIIDLDGHEFCVIEFTHYENCARCNFEELDN